MSARARCGLLALVMASACVPTLSGSDSLVSGTRILAIRAEPAEASPAAQVKFTALVATPGGTLSTAPVAWDFCTAQKPITEDNVVSSACLGGDALVAAGVGPTTTARTPGKGCSLFGPDTGSTGFRPRDPDSTGGFYQPLRASLAGAPDAFALARIHCDLPNASADAAAAFAKAYKLNQNPKLLPLTARGANGSDVALGSIPAGAHVTLEASWPPSSAETFAYYDPSSQTVTTQRESMQVAWYASDGSFDTESTGRASDDTATTSDDGWQAPGVSQTTHVWIILRDSRGGIDFASYDLVTVH